MWENRVEQPYWKTLSQVGLNKNTLLSTNTYSVALLPSKVQPHTSGQSNLGTGFEIVFYYTVDIYSYKHSLSFKYTLFDGLLEQVIWQILYYFSLLFFS